MMNFHSMNVCESVSPKWCDGGAREEASVAAAAAAGVPAL